jgi:hypothetical protein
VKSSSPIGVFVLMLARTWDPYLLSALAESGTRSDKAARHPMLVMACRLSHFLRIYPARLVLTYRRRLC